MILPNPIRDTGLARGVGIIFWLAVSGLLLMLSLVALATWMTLHP